MVDGGAWTWGRVVGGWVGGVVKLEAIAPAWDVEPFGDVESDFDGASEDQFGVIERRDGDVGEVDAADLFSVE